MAGIVRPHAFCVADLQVEMALMLETGDSSIPTAAATCAHVISLAPPLLLLPTASRAIRRVFLLA